MVVKEEILDWFKRQHSHQRLDVLCSLFDFCLPFERRFAANYIDVLIKRDTFAHPENEVVSSLEKNAAGWDPGASSLGEESFRRKLIFTLALNPANKILVQTVSKFLCSTSALQYLKLLDGNCKPPVSCSTTDWTSTYHEVLLIYTMAMYHPSFTVEERVELGSRYISLKNLLATVEQMNHLGKSTNEKGPTQNNKPSYPHASSQSSDKQPSLVSAEENSSEKDQQNSSPTKKFSNQHRYANSRRVSRNFPNSSYENNVNSKRLEAANGEAHRNSNCSNCNNADYLTPQLRDQMGPERFRKFWKKLEQYPLSQLRALSDEQLQEIGLTPPLIARLRKVLRSSLNLAQPSKSSTNGVCSPSSADQTEKSKSDTSHEESSNPRQQQQSPINSSTVPSSTMIKSLTGPPNVLPPFSSSSSANSQQHPPSRAESLSSSSSSMETPSPPASRSSSPAGKGARRRAAEQQQRMPPSRPAPLPSNPPAGLRPRLPFSGSLNLPYVRPSSTANVLTVNTVRPQHHQQPSNSRGASQPRDLPINAMTVPSQPSASYMLTNTTPPPNLEMPPIPMYQCHGYLSLGGTGSGEAVSGLVSAQPYAQPPFPYMTTATTPGTPISSPYATSYYLHNPILTQSVAPPPSGSNTNGRHVEYPAFVSQGPILYPRPNFDFSRHPPPGTTQPSCYNCGASGHRGSECREFSPEDVIKLASA